MRSYSISIPAAKTLSYMVIAQFELQHVAVLLTCCMLIGTHLHLNVLIEV
jgi:hypothetical protein